MFKTIAKKTKELWQLLIAAGTAFAEDRCMKMSASLAYYTVFSIGPLLLILTWALGFFYGHAMDGSEEARSQIIEELNELFGREIASLLESTVHNLSLDSRSNIGIIVGAGTLMFTSTTIFVDIQNSINTIWKVKPKPKKGWLKIIINRLISFSMILGLVFLLMASLIISSVIGIMTDYFSQFIEGLNLRTIDWLEYINYIFNNIGIIRYNLCFSSRCQSTIQGYHGGRILYSAPLYVGQIPYFTLSQQEHDCLVLWGCRINYYFACLGLLFSRDFVFRGRVYESLRHEVWNGYSADLFRGISQTDRT